MFYATIIDMIFEDSSIQILKINEKAKKLGVIRFDKGSPSPRIPETFDDDFEKKVSDKLALTVHSYPNGYSPLINLIQDVEKKVNKRRVKKENICLTNGAISGIFYALATLCNKGDAVVLNDLSFEGFSSVIKLLGLRPVVVSYSHLNGLEDAVGKEKPSVLLLNSPENPSGRLYDSSFLQKINSLAVSYNFYVLSDEVNNENVYAPYSYTPPCEYIDQMHLITVNSLSKNYYLYGLRLGWVIAQEEILKKIRSAIEVSQVGVNCASQVLGYELVLRYAKDIKDFKKKMLQQKELGESLLQKEGLEYIRPVTAGSVFFVYVGKDGEKLSKYLLEERKVGVIPGVYFGQKWKEWIRVGFGAVTNDDLKQGIPEIKRSLLRF